MAFGLGKLATAIEHAGEKVPAWIVKTLKRADEEDVLKRLTEDAVSAIRLTVEIPEIPVRLWGRKIVTLGPFYVRIIGRHPISADGTGGEDTLP